ncbi:ketoacyl-synt-domain-containing protein [Aspergillus indologenus CBS 114.80]|uniref:Ketoacyl-synt-domain-containing protein n=1 Tax=Aspergillus indologenus CBS 114.80 TaxID=1450541 RepID=A0A2V5JFI0_9EURO|nr:ketoacyl-synt-domain-containing protein [Aspergillus indologenus CBS 114.80]
MSSSSASPRREYPDHAIAVVGMSCRLPGARSPEEFWELLAAGRCMATKPPDSRFPLQAHWRSEDRLSAIRGNFLDEVDSFDHRFFGRSSREAVTMDPAQRLLLEATYHALESSHYFQPGRQPETDVGCYIGGFGSDYNDNLAAHPPSAFAALGCLRAFRSGRISHFFNWTGPSITLDTACSSSGVAIDAACKDLLLGNCTAALAGGVEVMTSPYLYQNLAGSSFLSPTGKAAPFDAEADGYSRGEGVGLVFLKRLDVAQQAGDPILGVICASAVRQISNEVTITAPDPTSHQALYRRLLTAAAIGPHEITYVEAHAAGTRVGDIPEYKAIVEVFAGPSRKAAPMCLTSVKANIGHAEGASGVVGLIKVILMMQHRQIPPQANLTQLHSEIDQSRDHILVPREMQPWQAQPMVACVNNFGAAGNITAMIVKQPPTPESGSGEERAGMVMYPVCIAAHSPDALEQNCRTIEQWLQSRGATTGICIEDVALSLSRKMNLQLRYRWSATVQTLPELIRKLQAVGNRVAVQSLARPKSPKPVVLLFSGQTGTSASVDRILYETCSRFRYHLDECARAIGAVGGTPLYPAIFEDIPCHDLVTLHGRKFSIQYSCARAWVDSGLQVARMLGHSIGQLVALCASGALSLQDGLKLIIGRARLIETQWSEDKGAMVAVQATSPQEREALSEYTDLEIACYNGPSSYVLAGPEASIQNAIEKMEGQQVRQKRLGVTHAYHSRLTEPILKDLHALASELTFLPSRVHLEPCSVTQSWHLPTPDLICQQTREPVHFQAAVERIDNELGPCAWLEADLGSVTVQMASAAIPDEVRKNHTFLAGRSLNPQSLADVTRGIWEDGQNVDFWSYQGSTSHRKRLLTPPMYSFTRYRHWLEWKESSAPSKPLPPTEQKIQLVALRGYQDRKTGGNCRFEIDPRAHEWALLVDQHALSGTGVCPASLYVDIVMRSAQLIPSPTQDGPSPHIGVVEGLQIFKPLGRVHGKKLMLAMQPNGRTPRSWDFAFYAEPSIRSATGRIRFADEADDLTQRTFNLITLDSTCQSIMAHNHSSDQACDMGGDVLYRLLAPVVTYGSIYQLIRSWHWAPQYARARLQLPQDPSLLSNSDLIPPVVLEGLLQVAGAHANLFKDASQARGMGLYVCTQARCIQPSPDLSWESCHAGWQVVARAIRQDPTSIEYDILAFVSGTGQLVLAVYGVEFRHTPAGLVEKTLTSISTAAPSPCVVRSPYAEREARVRGPDVTGDIAGGIDRILGNLVNDPVNGLSSTTNLQSIGVDSLGINELRQKIKKEYNVDIAASNIGVQSSLETLYRCVQTQVAPASPLSCTPSLSHSESFTHSEDTSPGSEAHSDEPASVADRLQQVLEAHLGPLEVAEPAATMADLGVDSLLSQELMGDIEKEFACPKDKVQMQATTTFSDLCASLGGHQSRPVAERLPSIRRVTTGLEGRPQASPQHADWKPQISFDKIQRRFPELARQNDWLGFWDDVHPLQLELIVAYVLDAFAQLGCDLRTMEPGSCVPSIPVGPGHGKLKLALYDILRHAGILDAVGSTEYIRADKHVIVRSAAALHQELMEKHPQHRPEHELLQLTGPDLAGLITGTIDPLQRLFGSVQHRQLLTDFYGDAPMFRTMNQLLCDFVKHLAMSPGSPRPIRILELGAGTGASTVPMLEILSDSGVPFQYCFTDISSSLVATAQRRFKAYHDSMRFMVVDIEQPPSADLVGRFDLIVATNCLHATRNLQRSLSNARQMLQPNGLVCLHEVTRRIFLLDAIFGLLDGWWLFDDGRSYALGSPATWDNAMRSAGFQQVMISDGPSPEAQTVRLVCGFASECDEVPSYRPPGEVDCETLVWKTGTPHLSADIYYPPTLQLGPALHPTPALLLHGGANIMLSRKHVPRDQIQFLLGQGIVLVSVDFRLCPEVNILDGPMTDTRDALHWVRTQLPQLRLKHRGLCLDGGRVGVIGWSSGGTLALLLGQAWDSPGYRPPEAIVSFYCPTDFEDPYFTAPRELPAQSPRKDWDPSILDDIQSQPISGYNFHHEDIVTAYGLAARSPRARIYTHMLRHGQTLQIFANGLPPRSAIPNTEEGIKSILFAPPPPTDRIRQFSPYAGASTGRHLSPTYLLHGKRDQLVPWTQALRMHEALQEHGIETELVTPEDGLHLFDLGAGGVALDRMVEEAYRWLAYFLRVSG